MYCQGQIFGRLFITLFYEPQKKRSTYTFLACLLITNYFLNNLTMVNF